MAKLFVYGTLRRSGTNHPLLERNGGTFVSTDCVTGKLGKYAPNLFALEEGANLISGEVFEVPDDIWPILDLFEGVEHGLYHRTRMTTSGGLRVFVYVAGTPEKPYIQPFWRASEALE